MAQVHAHESKNTTVILLGKIHSCQYFTVTSCSRKDSGKVLSQGSEMLQS